MATEAEKAPKVEKTNRRAANETRKDMVHDCLWTG